MVKKIYKLKAKVWVYPGPAPWHFITIPKKEAAKIREEFGHLERGWRSLPLRVIIGKTNWKTSMFWDGDEGSYILPIKKQVRRAENIKEGDEINFRIDIIA